MQTTDAPQKQAAKTSQPEVEAPQQEQEFGYAPPLFTPVGMMVNPGNILRLQRIIGNRAVQRLIAPQTPTIQRDEDEAAPEEDIPLALDPETEALLNQIGVLSDEPDIPAFEAITGTTGAELSGGELEGEIERLWRREHLSFTEAARRAAEENTGGEDAPVAAQSAALEAETAYTQRWALNLFAADYESGHDVALAEIMRRGSPYQQSLAAEFGRVIPVRNPTGDEIRSQIFDAIMALSQALNSGEIGELVVTFSGHGTDGYIDGVDWVQVGPTELSRMGELARDFNVHLIFILDTCRAGRLVSFAQAQAGADIGERISGLPAEEQAQARAQMTAASALGPFLPAMSHEATEIHTIARREYSGDAYVELVRLLRSFEGRTGELGTTLTGEAFQAEGLPDISALQAQQTLVFESIHWNFGENRRAVLRLLRQIAILLDLIGNTVNQILVSVNERTTATTPTSTRSTTSSETTTTE